jgi:hypothetical protein
MNIEQIFAADVFNAPRVAAEARKRGYPQTVSDVVDGALCDLWQYDRARAQAIANKWVYYDADGNPWPRKDIDWGNVAPITTKR